MQVKVGDTGDWVKEILGTPVVHHLNQITLGDLQELKKPIVAVVDGDIIAYRCSATADGRVYKVVRNDNGEVVTQFSYKKDADDYIRENSTDMKRYSAKLEYIPEPVENALSNVKKLMDSMKKDLGAASMETYLTPEILFRSEYMSDYKANRIGMRKPTHLKACKEFLEKNYGAELVNGYEADDLIAIRSVAMMDSGEYTPVICSLDKDLDMIAGYHYNWTKKFIYFVTPEEGTLNFYKQILIGDKTDNIPGLYGVGPKTAEKILEECDGSSSYQCYIKVLDAFLEKTPKLYGESDVDFHVRVVTTITRNARLLYILHNLGEVWVPPVAITEEKSDG